MLVSGALTTDHLADAGMRQGNYNGAICNCNGLWAQGKPGTAGRFVDYPSAPSNLQTVMWLGLVTSEMASNMVFVLETGSFADASIPGDGWSYTIQVPLWGAKARQLLPSFTAPFGTRHPNVTVSSAVALRSGASQAGITGRVVRARAWLEPECSTICAHVIVVNLDRESPAQFTLTLNDIVQPIAGSDINASRIFDAGYNVTLTLPSPTSATLSDFVAADGTNVYEIGCGGPRPAPCVDPNGEPCNDHRSWNGSAMDWTCASRRVLCKHGFVAKDPYNATCMAL